MMGDKRQQPARLRQPVLTTLALWSQRERWQGTQSENGNSLLVLIPAGNVTGQRCLQRIARTHIARGGRVTVRYLRKAAAL